mgnify:CR=1 FL=1
MSDLMINVRFWYYHLQVSKRFRRIRWVKNDSLVENGLDGYKKIEVFKFF